MEINNEIFFMFSVTTSRMLSFQSFKFLSSLITINLALFVDKSRSFLYTSFYFSLLWMKSKINHLIKYPLKFNLHKEITQTILWILNWAKHLISISYSILLISWFYALTITKYFLSKDKIARFKFLLYFFFLPYR